MTHQSQGRYFRHWVLIVTTLIIFLLVTVTANSTQTCCAYFWGKGCPHCTNASPHVDSFDARFPNVEVRKYEIHDTVGASMFQKYVKAFNIPANQQGTPSLFIGGKQFIGDVQVIAFCDGNSVTNYAGSKCLADDSSDGQQHQLTVWAVILAALADSINPCAIAVLVILLTALIKGSHETEDNDSSNMEMGSVRSSMSSLHSEDDMLVEEHRVRDQATKKPSMRALVSGFTFILGVYICYLGMGLGILSLVSTFSAAAGEWLARVVAILSLIMALLNFKDCIWYGGGGFKMEVPESWRPRMKQLLRGATHPVSAFFVGILCSFFELPCTGGPYLVILALLAYDPSQALMWLVIYNAIFVLPLVLINIAAYAMHNWLTSLEALRQRHLRSSHFISGCILAGLGIAILVIY